MNKFLVLIILFGLHSCSKLPDDTLQGSLENKLSESKDFIVLESTHYSPTKTFIFYPGGLVDPHSYLNWQDALVTQNPDLRIVTVKMPSNLAVINSQKGKLVLEEYPESEKWLVAGHSLGGAMATNFVANHQSKIDALIFLAAYPTDDRLSDFPNSILSIYAENDGLTSIADIEKYYDDLPTPYMMQNATDFPSPLNGTTCYYQILGGNHAQFGNYGEQKGDNEATISSEEQQLELVTLISNYLEVL